MGRGEVRGGGTHDDRRVPFLGGAVVVGVDVGEDGVTSLMVRCQCIVAEGCGEGDTPPW